MTSMRYSLGRYALKAVVTVIAMSALATGLAPMRTETAGATTSIVLDRRAEVTVNITYGTALYQFEFGQQSPRSEVYCTDCQHDQGLRQLAPIIHEPGR